MRKIWTLLLMLSLFSGFTVMASGDEETPTPTPPPVGRRAATQGEAPTSTPDLDCDATWFFDNVSPFTCPEDDPLESEMVFQRFEYGYMIWVQNSDMIYVMYHSQENPRWQAVEDPYTAGMPEVDYSWSEEQPPQSAQPRLGFGALWREDDELRERIGWAVQQWEFVYDGHVQTATDGTIYVEDPNGGVFALLPGSDDWKLYRK